MQDIVLRSSLIVLFDRTCLSGDNYFWGKFYCEGAILHGPIFFGGNYPEDNHPGGNDPGGSFPRTLQNVSAPCCICF